MKIVLFTLNASYVHTSLSLRILKKKLTEKDFDVTVIEATPKDKRLSVLNALYEEEAEVYGFSAYIWNITELAAFAAKLKALRPEAAIVFGGPEVSYSAKSFLEEHPYVDFVIAGEGEEALPQLCTALAERGFPVVKAEGKIITATRYEGFARDGVPYHPGDTDRPIVYYESSRGCPYSCAYCLSAAEKGVRAKDAETVLRDLIAFEAMPQVKVVKFVDRTFNYDRHRALAIWRGLKSDVYTKTYHFEISAERIDDEALTLLASFPIGKLQLEAGVQSTNPEVLAAIDRQSDINLCLQRLSALRRLGNIHIHADLIAGLPHEDLASFARSFDDLYPCCDNLQLGFLKILKGTPLAAREKEYGILAAETPPYEVLRTGTMSFADLMRLHRIESVLERFGNSGHFTYTLQGAMKKIASPFAFFDGLATAVGAPERLSQLRAYQALKEYCLPLFGEENEAELIGRLRLDYCIHETGSYPAFLLGGELPILPVRRSLAQKTAQKNAATELSVTATEVHRYVFDPEGYYVIDRKQHICERVVSEV